MIIKYRKKLMINERVNKRILAIHFSKSASNYDKHALLQKEIAFQLVEWADLERISRQADARVLEIGCGTGFLTGFLAEKLNPEAYLAIDLARGMLETARAKPESRFSRVRFIQADGEALPFAAGVFDLAASSTTFQWFNTIGESLAGTHRALRPGGKLIFTTLGRDTYRELKEAYRTSAGQMGIKLTPSRYGLLLPGAVELADFLVSAGFEKPVIKRQIKYEFFPSAREYMQSVKNRGFNNPSYRPMNLAVERTFLRKTIDFYDRRFRVDGRVYASYEVFFVQSRLL